MGRHDGRSPPLQAFTLIQIPRVLLDHIHDVHYVFSLGSSPLSSLTQLLLLGTAQHPHPPRVPSRLLLTTAEKNNMSTSKLDFASGLDLVWQRQLKEDFGLLLARINGLEARRKDDDGRAQKWEATIRECGGVNQRVEILTEELKELLEDAPWKAVGQGVLNNLGSTNRRIEEIEIGQRRVPGLSLELRNLKEELKGLGKQQKDVITSTGHELKELESRVQKLFDQFTSSTNQKAVQDLEKRLKGLESQSKQEAASFRYLQQKIPVLEKECQRLANENKNLSTELTRLQNGKTMAPAGPHRQPQILVPRSSSPTMK